MKHIVALTLLLTMGLGIARTLPDVTIFTGDSIQVKIPVRDYTKVTESISAAGSDTEKSGELFDIVLTRRHPLGGNESDTGTVCRGTIAVCESIGRGVVPYWFDANRNLRIGSPTDSVHEISLSARRAFEAFHLCAWVQNGVTMPFGGQCYTLVLPLESKVVSLSFLLGRNVGCKTYETCWRQELKKARWIADNVF
ncbi:hypothetical protein QO239_06585 [Cupriavidus taiwanensis]|uniref:hypothetical protein n=1 Tax=Cupriavidus taiwanensis TaxID=164546 RepID=UPI0025423458|nr:hypothetical protein [Cupriavidus taiwanensis]MDK3022276.1 hypothetical protein [Cupriavidus taiwanensis]